MARSATAATDRGGDQVQVRLAELVGALSLGIDLGFGQPMEHVLRQCLIAVRIAERLGLEDQQRADVYYTALLVNVGCHADAHEQAKWFGDDLALKAHKYDHEFRSVRGVLAGIGRLGGGRPPLHRFRVGLEFALGGHRELDDMIAQHARIARSLGEQLELRETVLDALGSAYEQWDGKGWPGKVGRHLVPLPARIAAVAEFTEVAHRLGGIAAVRELVRSRSGGQFDPMVAELVDRDAEAIYAGLDGASAWGDVIDAEPALAVTVAGEAFDRALTAIANFVDLKSPYTLGHSVAVAQLARAAGEQLGLDPADASALERAALVHDFGRLGVSNAIWDREGPLGAGQWERVRLYPHITERMLQQAASLTPITRIAVQVQERLDGSGYPHALRGSAIARPARVLAAADSYQALREPRAHRPAWEPATAAAILRREAQAGRLDGDAVEAVLAAAGHRVRLRREGPAGLTAREVEVLRLLAQGLSNKEIAERLVISPKTAGTHIEHIYAKIDASSRATASVFAVQHGLLPEEQLVRAGT